MRIVVLAVAFASLAACATAARETLENRFEAIGLSPKMASCMVADIDERLSDDDMRDLARYTVGLSRADTPGKAIDQLLAFDNPRAVAAIGRAAFSCVTGFDR